jgi:L-Ala-D/L-Glu epimerase
MSLTLTVTREEWPLTFPFRISGHTFASSPCVLVSLRQGAVTGRGEAQGVYYRNDTVESMVAQIESVRSTIERGINRTELQQLLPLGGARNALDCALWDLESRLQGTPAWKLAGLEPPRPLITTFTCGADSPEVMAERALLYRGARAIKLKLTGAAPDAQRVQAVREACPDVWLGVDANQGFTRAFLQQILPDLVAARVALIEQPFAIGREADLDGFESPIPIAADESLQGLADLPSMPGRFDVINIKLDKCGGLTEGLALARAARDMGLQVMVGNMTGTSLAMAPSFLVGQLCQVVDLDGPALLSRDREIPVRYDDGHIDCPAALWGGGRA